jgi:hypothetical protein
MEMNSTARTDHDKGKARKIASNKHRHTANIRRLPYTAIGLTSAHTQISIAGSETAHHKAFNLTR